MDTGNFTPVYRYKYGEPEFLIDYKGSKLRYPFYEVLPEIETFEADQRDVVIASFPKAGTTLVSVMVHLIQNDADPECLQNRPIDDAIEMLEMCLPDQQPGTRPIDRLKQKVPPRTFATHLAYPALPESIKEKAKIVYVARNPKDSIVSLHNHHLGLVGMGFNGTLEDTVQDFFNNQRNAMPFFDHVAGYWSHRNKPDVFFVTFEEILKDFRKVAKDLGTFLGKSLTDDQLDVIAHHCKFDVMKNNKNTNRSASKGKVLDPKKSNFMRSGKAGNWRQHLTVDMNERVDAWIAREEKRLADQLSGFCFEYS